MRDILVTALIFGSLPYIFKRPYIGILVWTWISFMNPHRLTWGFAFDMPFAMIVGLATLVAMFASREPKKIPWTRESVVLLMFVIWMVVTTTQANYPTLAWPHLSKVLKIQLMVFVTMMLMQTRQRIDLLVWTMALSLAFYGVKGGIFTILNGGAYHVRGPAASFIGGDNEMGLALVMTIPLLHYLQTISTRIWIRHSLSVAMGLTALAAVGSQSRGALLGIASMGIFFWLKSRQKFMTGILAIVAVGLIATVMPQQWYDRMATIQTYEKDNSAKGRLNAWQMAFNLAKDRPLGGGFDTFRELQFAMYAPDPDDVHDAHSIYFEILGEHGFVGLGLFLLLAVLTWRTASAVAKKARRSPETRWAADLSSMVQVSLIGYATTGAFLGLAYFDYYYTLIAVVVLTKTVFEAGEVKSKPSAVYTGEPVTTTAAGGVPAATARASSAPRS